jgi:hypothetical protein
VKDTFGTVVNTVVDQNEDIKSLSTGLEKTNEEIQASQTRILRDTGNKYHQLMKQNLLLKEHLFRAHKQLKTFSYNMQGYADPLTEDDQFFQIQEFPVFPSLIPEDPPASLFPTETGAHPQESLSLQAPAKQKKKKNVYVEINGILVEYRNIPPFLCPASASGKWNWACRKILQRFRRKKYQVSCATTKVDKSQTFSGKMEILDDEIFHLSTRTDAAISQVRAEAAENFKEVLNLKTDVSELGRQCEEEKLKVVEQFNQFHDNLQKVERTVEESISRLQSEFANFQSMTSDMAQTKQLIVNTQQYLYCQNDSKMQMIEHMLTDFTGKLKGLKDGFAQTLSLPGFSLSLFRKNEESVYSKKKRSDEYLERESNFQTIWKEVLENDNKFRPLKQKLDEIFSSSAFVEKNIQLLETELSHFEELSTDNLSAHANVLKTRLKDATNLLTSQRTSSQEFAEVLSVHDIVFHDLLGKFNKINDKLREQVRELSTDWNSAKISFDTNMKNMEKKYNEQLSKIAEDTSEAMEQCSVLSGYNRSKISIDDLSEEVASLKQLVEGSIANNSDYHEDNQNPDNDSFLEGQSLEDSVQDFESPEYHPGKDNITDETDDEVLAEPNSQIIDDTATRKTDTDDGNMAAKDGVDSEMPEGDKIMSLEPTTQQERPLSSSNVPGKLSRSISKKGSASRPPSSRPMSSKNRSSFDMDNFESIVTGIVKAQLMNMFSRPTSGAFSQSSPEKSSRLKESISKAIQQAEQYDNQPAPTLGSEEFFDGKKKKRRQSSLMGSFVDYEVKKSIPMKETVGGDGFQNLFDNGCTSVMGNGTTLSNPFDPAPLLNDISNIREQLTNINGSIGILFTEKATKEELQDVCLELLRDLRKKEMKQDSFRDNQLDELQKAMQDMNKELISLKCMQVSNLDSLRSDLESTVGVILSKFMHQISEGQDESVLSTRGLCLACGRPASTRAQTRSRPHSPPFLPLLNSTVVPGAEIFRAGFKMPGRSHSPLENPEGLKQHSLMSSVEGDRLNQFSHFSSYSNAEVPLILRNKVMTPLEATKKDLEPMKDFSKDFDSLNPTVIHLTKLKTDQIHSHQRGFDETVGESLQLQLTMPVIQNNHVDSGKNLI